MNKFTIGRGKDNDYVITHKMVSEKHAIIEIDENKVLTLKDLNSTNGTKVNGREIITKKITQNDEIQFGAFIVDEEDLFENLRLFQNKDRENFSKEFILLRQVEIEYKKKKHLEEQKGKIIPIAIRTSGVILIAFLLIKFDLVSKENRLYLFTIAGGLAGILATFTESHKQKKKLEDLLFEYAQEFKCPKCNFEMMNKSWNYWKKKKRCPKCNCIWHDKSRKINE